MSGFDWRARPVPAECEQYYFTYIDQVPAGDVLELLAREVEETVAFVRSQTADQLRHRYAPDKWSVADVIGHMIDVERVFATRGLAFARADREAYPGFEQDAYVAGADFDSRTPSNLADEFHHLRAANLALFRSWTPEEAMRTGTASGFRFTARTIPFILAGHEIHHRKVLRERYA